MPKKDFSFSYDIKTKTGKMTVGKKYIDLNPKISTTDKEKSENNLRTSSSGGAGYGINLI